MHGSFVTPRILYMLACLLVCKMTFVVVIGHRDYFPPNFQADFLYGRNTYFFGAYQLAFYVHILAGPFCLLSGLVLMSRQVRRRFPAWHRRLGRVHVACVLLFVAPSGLWMAPHAMTGRVAGTGFAMLAIVTAFCAALGWNSGRSRQFDRHARWMERSFLLLCSAVVLRVLGGFSEVFKIDGMYPLAAWLSWLFPLALLEITRMARTARLDHSTSVRHATRPDLHPME